MEFRHSFNGTARGETMFEQCQNVAAVVTCAQLSAFMVHGQCWCDSALIVSDVAEKNPFLWREQSWARATLLTRPDFLVTWWAMEHAVSMPWSMTLQYHGHFRSKFFKVFKSLHEILEVNKCITYFRYLKNLLEPTSFKFWEKRRQNLRRFSQKIEEKKLFKIPKLNLTLVSVTLEFTELESLV